MKNPITIAAAATLASSLLVAGIAAPATAVETTTHPVAQVATPPRSLEAIKSAADLAITKRLAALSKTRARVTSLAHLTGAHESTILGVIDADTADLTALNATIQADTDRATAASDYAQIFSTYRVFAVVLPQSYVAAGADAVTEAAVPALQKAHDALATALAAKPDASAQALLDQMQQQIDAARAAATGVADSALAVTPAEYNANHAVLADERASLVTAVAAAKQARLLGKQVRAALK